jgi:hypothetical protein
VKYYRHVPQKWNFEFLLQAALDKISAENKKQACHKFYKTCIVMMVASSCFLLPKFNTEILTALKSKV